MTRASIACALALLSYTASAQEPADDPPASTAPSPTESAEGEQAAGMTAEAREANDEEAQGLFVAARAAYDDGRFAEALDLFQRSYARSGRPRLLYNIASAHDRLDHEQEALSSYRAFLEAEPDAERANFVRGRIASLEAALSTENTRGSDQPQSAGRGGLVLPIALLAGAGAVGVAALGTGLRALGLRGSLRDACPAGECPASEQSTIDRMDRLALSTDILFGIAGALAVGGVLALVFRPKARTPQVACGPGGCSMHVEF